jgi:hypothetical protein
MILLHSNRNVCPLGHWHNLEGDTLTNNMSTSIELILFYIEHIYILWNCFCNECSNVNPYKFKIFKVISPLANANSHQKQQYGKAGPSAL